MALEKLGAEVTVIKADVSDKKQMESVCEYVKKSFGSVNGIIHSAGLPPDQAIYNKDKVYVENIFAPKLAGTIILSDVFSNDKLDFFFICSSVAAIGGSFGESDYSSANAFQDAFAYYYRKRTRARIFSIDWSLWREIGFAVDVKVPENMRKERDITLRYGISNSEGKIAFERIINKSETQLIVLPYERCDTKVDKTEESSGSNLYERPEQQVKYEMPRNDIERKIEECWQEVLGIKGIGINDNFYDLGGNSLSIIQLQSRR